jgi:hypothetical protein
MRLPRKTSWLLAGGISLGLTTAVHAQFAAVTMKLDANQIVVGATTTLHVYAQVIAAQRTNADRIFSWYVDLVNPAGSVADSSAPIIKSTSDQDPQTSSSGVLDGSNRRGIYDTFLNLPGAGVNAPVELFSVPVKGLSSGTVTFQITAGSGVPGLSEDFIVAPLGDGNPLLGGDYSQASVSLSVGTGGGGCQPSLYPSLQVQAGGNKQLALSFQACPGQNNIVEATSDLAHPSWVPLPGAPHNSGSVTDPITSGNRFYRVHLE